LICNRVMKLSSIPGNALAIVKKNLLVKFIL
jgi:hypothetical protein